MSEPDVTIIKEKSSGSGMIIALVALALIALAAFWLISNNSTKVAPSDANVAAAADKVGAAADKVGNAVQDAVKK
mgnify:CR=1 FL=1